MGTRLSHAELAARKNVTRQRVETLIAEGRLTEDADGKIDVEEADQVWETIDPSYALRRDTAKANEDPAAAKKKNNAALVFSQAKASSEVLRSRKLKLELEQLEGNLVPRDQVKAEALAAGKVLATRLQNLTRKLAPAVAPIRDVNECAVVIEREITAIVNEVRDALEKL